MKVSISCPNPSSQLLHIAIEYDQVEGEILDLQLPAWRPGRYELQNYASKMTEVCAFGGEGLSEQLDIHKLSRNVWRVGARGYSRVRVEYLFHANTLDAGGSWLEDGLTYINFINCILYRYSDLENPVAVNLDMPTEYQLATSLKRINANTLVADNFHELVDSPLIASSSLRKLQYEVGKITFSIWFQGSDGLQEGRIIRDFKDFTVSQIELFGEFPVMAYHFLILTSRMPLYHGVEHSASTVIALGPDYNFTTPKAYEDLLGISSHELFHTWNVKRIKPKELTPYDYSKEVYFETGYIAEGITTYYGDLMLARSGVFDKNQYLAEINKYLRRHFHNGGRLHRSLSESSKDLWIDGYKPSIAGRKVSIYIKGALIALTMDLILRIESAHVLNADGVMKLFWRLFGKSDVGYTSGDYQDILESYSGSSWQLYFDDYVNGTKDLEPILKELFEIVGLDLIEAFPENLLECHFGIKVSKTNKIILIDPLAQAYHWVRIGDIIEEVNGSSFDKDMELAKDIGSITLKVNRLGIIKNIELTKSEHSFFRYVQVIPNEHISDEQLDNYDKWIQQS